MSDSDKRAPDEAIARAAMALFDRYLEADGAERDAILSAAASEAEVHARLVELIAADAAAERDRFLDDGALAQVAPDEHEEHEETLRDLTGTQLGPWRLSRLLGAGGAGQVWLARREDGLPARQAAVKLLRAAATDGLAQQRFAREARLLARLDHPHIAHLLEVGDDARGQRYLVLEHVDGERIDSFCDRSATGIEERLGLFLQVCDAVAYAHSQLIVHRDLKPSNILVQADGTAKLLDFGVAKLLEHDDEAPELTELTRAGSAPFTPEYAAPEQFERQPITVATDIYSLGGVLYLLLCGRRPLGNDAVTPAQLARAVQELEPRRASFVDPTLDTERIARQRGMTAQQLQRTLRGDLDTIVAKALKKDPRERYASVQAFASDVRRYLARQPIMARPDSRLYQARMFVTRHRLAVTLAAALVVVLMTTSAVLLVQARRLAAEAKRANTIKEFLLDAFRDADAYASNGDPAHDTAALLGRAARHIDAKLGSDTAARAEVHLVIARSFFRLGHYGEARENFQRAGALYRVLDGERSPRALSVEAEAIGNEWAHGDVDGLMPRIDALLANIGTAPQGRQARSVRWQALDAKTVTAQALGDLALAEATARRCVADVRASPDAGTYSLTFAEWRLALVLLDAGTPHEADLLMRDVVARDLKLVARTHPGLLTDLLAIADVLIDYGDDSTAARIADVVLALRRRLYGPTHRDVASALDRTAFIAANLDRDARAEADFAAAEAFQDGFYSARSRDLVPVRYAFGLYLLRRARLREASAQLAACERVFAAATGDWSWQRAACQAAAAYCASAPDELDRLIAAERAHHARELPTALWLRARLGGTRAQRLGWLDEAAAVLRASERDGSRVGRDIEAARISLGAPPAPPPPPRAADLARAADAVLAVLPSR